MFNKIYLIVAYILMVSGLFLTAVQFLLFLAFFFLTLMLAYYCSCWFCLSVLMVKDLVPGTTLINQNGVVMYKLK